MPTETRSSSESERTQHHATGSVRSRHWQHPFAIVSVETVHRRAALVECLRAAEGLDVVSGVAAVESIHRQLEATLVPHVLPLVAIERVEGNDLRLVHHHAGEVSLLAAVRNGGLPLARVFAIIGQVCRCLVAAHRAGVHHRLLGPASVLLRRSGDREDVVSLIDFGIAPLVEKRDFGLAFEFHPVTPESVLGGGTGGSEDIYLVGCLLHWLVRGAPPFDARDLPTLRRRHAIEDPPQLVLSTHGPTGKTLDQIASRALDKEPEDRYRSMDELAEALANAQWSAGITTAWDDAPASAARGRPRPKTPSVAATHLRLVEPSASTVSPRCDGDGRNVVADRRVPGWLTARRRIALISIMAVLTIGTAWAATARPLGGSAQAIRGFDSCEPRADVAHRFGPASTHDSEPTTVIATAASSSPPIVERRPTRGSSSSKASSRQDSGVECDIARRSATDARVAHDWTGVLRHTAKTSCWRNSEARAKLRTQAFLEIARFGDCLRVGGTVRAPDPQLTRWLDLCRKRLKSR